MGSAAVNSADESANTTPSRRLKSLAVVVPFFNEAASVRAFYERLRAAAELLNCRCAFVFVDDGSRDPTLRILNELADKDPRVSVLSFSRNWGHQLALTAGLDHVDDQVGAAVTMDGDLQHPPETIARMVQQYELGSDVVHAVRREHKGAGVVKRLSSLGFNSLLSWSTDVHIIRGAADFRLISGDVIRVLRSMRELHRYLRGMVPWAGFPATTIEYDEEERHAGTPGYTWRRSLRLAQHGVFSFSVLPLHLITWLGVICAVAAAAYLGYVAVVAFNGRVVTGWPSVIGVMLLVSAFQFLALSILAQYLGMVFEQGKQRPLYVFKQVRLSQPMIPASTDPTDPESRPSLIRHT